MDNNYQPNENTQVTYEAQAVHTAPPVQPVYGVSAKPFNMPVMVSFLMKLTAFFIPGLGFILGCLVNLTPYDNKAKISHSILKLSAAMFVITLIILAICLVVGIVATILSIATTDGGTMFGLSEGAAALEDVVACIF